MYGLRVVYFVRPNKTKTKMEEDGRGTVCVTGGTGFLASWLIMRLLERGYTVHTTIRHAPADGKRDISFLTDLPKASENLKVFSADLSNPESFRSAVEGCIGVFHVATPVDFEDREPEQVVTNRAITGAVAILKACLDSRTVKRVVYTSSVATVVNNKSVADIVDESSWSDVNFIRDLKWSGSSYAISKTLTEKAVLEFGQQYGLDVVTVLPSVIVGPFICTKFPSSVRVSLALVRGNEADYPFIINANFVHVDDVALAHIFLFELPPAKGRYICSHSTLTLEELSNFLSKRYPEFEVPTIDSLKDVKGHKFPGVSSKKLLDAGFKFKYGLEDMFDDAIKCCKEKGYL